jgi:serine/threonine protein kinase
LLTLQLRDPQVDLRTGRQSPRRPSEQELIKAVRLAATGQNGVDARGYRDYRGARVVGAWRWLADFDIGLATQQDLGEAFGLAVPIRAGFWIMFGFLTIGSAVVYILMRAARKAALRATRFGQYTLDDEIGSGGFGNVFRGRHALMHRPVAVKVLSPLADSRAVARFEREVQLTCQLSHPNTIALYDYGHTPEGLFYYAMEYLEGLSLAQLIEKHGAQPEGRVIHILRQVCGSLAEAHSKGLVHRDIKPHNIFLTNRGGIPDFVKVLDFGLVKARDLPEQVQLTGANATLGTPLYMSPESVKSPGRVDAASDLYSLGSVAYELLSGQPVFSGSTVGEVMVRQVQEMPERPSVRMKRPVSPDFEDLLMQCLAKRPGDRPASAAALERALAQCTASGAWTLQDAADWWQKHAAAPNAKTAVLPVT